MSLGAILGGIAGLITGGGTAMAAAVGAGLGSLASGGSLEDALKSGGMAFGIGSIPGVGSFAQNLGGQLGGGMFSSAVSQKAKGELVKKGAEAGLQKGGFSLMSPGGIMTAATFLGALEEKDKVAEQPVGSGERSDYAGRVVVKPYIDEEGKRTFQNPDGLGIMSTPQATGQSDPSQSDLVKSVLQNVLMNKLENKGVAYPQPIGSRGMLMANTGGYIEGPGTGRSDDVRAGIFQNGQKVQEARLSDGEFVMTRKAVDNAGGGDRERGAAKMYALMNNLENRVA